jgi:hypothetical protein
MPGPVVIKKEDEPLLNLTGALSRCSRKNVQNCCVQGRRSPVSKYRGFGVYSMNKTRSWRKMFITGAYFSAAQHLLSPFSSPFFMTMDGKP